MRKRGVVHLQGLIRLAHNMIVWEMVKVDILLATNGSLEAKKAEKAALQITKSYNIRMAALFVVNVMSAHSTPELNRAIERGERVLDEVVAEGRKIGVEVQKILRIGRISDTILSVAKSLRVNTIVIGSEGKRELRILLGMVTGKVVRDAECTVIVAR